MRELPAAVPRDKVKEAACSGVRADPSVVTLVFRSIKGACTALITRGTAGRGSAGVSGSFRGGIRSRVSSSLLPSNDFPLPASFSTFLLSAAFFCFFFLFFFFCLPALISPLVCWQRPGRSYCGFWRSHRVWSRHGRCQGGHVRSLRAPCGGRLDGWMDVWAWGCWHALPSFFSCC